MNKTATLRRQAVALVREIADEGKAEQDTALLVDIGHALWLVSDEAERAITPFKDRLRDEAKKVGDEIVLLRGFSGQPCKVVVSKPIPTVPRADALKPLLGDAFDLLFETVTTYKVRENFADTLLTLPTEQQQAILRRMKMIDPTPRVSFKVRE